MIAPSALRVALPCGWPPCHSTALAWPSWPGGGGLEEPGGELESQDHFTLKPCF